ncbi:enoyl-CoA hydratase/isomerase family protein [Sinorhizobium meliloti]|uniref:enoyl-CoA hydratase/isomerase family protein n=1 Tax=Rhizobium meliloti TaxID=382 RepID=UPI000B49AB77|nr:enoyl-CoA hydratase/isomerase family protein [Sinorhizobium meliloti]ASQ06542.1 enoyl-CoA hydratase/isomerase family protein [Sinorhizobium meliloti]MDW9794352.1 enoyl-CoA hydratase/isomerase family protein [Sinorhizobium meliloti]MDW9831505.1 enoyl-CoA hydratase/isomerase family protein [Sinorhizobium meliloti]MDX0067283.1 enoyl-CoA hydratase/isomerase family protein [Sinorhizobium meliloti]MDX0085636.1 enoyl-CoA hydratase/isomerase family protein [Sinorhizobium meliloti]
MADRYILIDKRDSVAIITLNRPKILNAWHAPMRLQLIEAFVELEADRTVRAIVLTGAGDRAFCAGQDLNEAKTFDGDTGSAWIAEWERLYGAIRSLSKPLIAALNGVAAGSAFQVALLCDFRIGHAAVRMGQPEINSGIASVTGPWIMREMLGLARTTDLTLSGRFMDAEECHAIGIINQIVPAETVLGAALSLALELGRKPPVAMRLDKHWLREMTESGFRECLDAAVRIHREAYASGETALMMEKFLAERASRKA